MSTLVLCQKFFTLRRKVVDCAHVNILSWTRARLTLRY